MFRINYQLRKADQIVPWGEKEKTLHWFGLTDGLLWINAGDAVIYEYSDAARLEFDKSIGYNDYQLARFLEDFSEILPYAAEPVPKIIYDSAEYMGEQLYAWEQIYSDKSDEEFFDKFLPELYDPLCLLYRRRTLDSLHLKGGPDIGFFRYGDRLKLFWKGEYKLKDGSSIWKYPEGVCEMDYSEFVSETERFFRSFESDMDEQVNDVLVHGIKGVIIDTDKLIKENTLRKESFSQKISALKESDIQVKPWTNELSLYDKMISEIAD